MSIEDKIAKALLKKHRRVSQANGWFTDISTDLDDNEMAEYKHAGLSIGGVEIDCMIADKPDLQVQGLQGHDGLGPYEGMIFPSEQIRRVAFHMGSVAFPIDMIFVGDDARVTRIVDNVEPGQQGQWGMPHISAVIEVNGGFCAAHGIEVGAKIKQPNKKIAQADQDGIYVVTLDPAEADEVAVVAKSAQEALYTCEHGIYAGATDVPDEYYDSDIPVTITGFGKWQVYGPYPADGSSALPQKPWPESKIVDFMREQKYHFKLPEDIAVGEAISSGAAGSFKPPPDEVKYLHSIYKMAQETFPSYPRKDINPKQVTPVTTNPADRFRDRDISDERVKFNQMDPSRDETEGYDQTKTEQDLEDIGPVRPL